MRFIEAQPISRRPTLSSVSTSGAACPGQSPVTFPFAALAGNTPHAKFHCLARAWVLAAPIEHYPEAALQHFGLASPWLEGPVGGACEVAEDSFLAPINSPK